MSIVQCSRFFLWVLVLCSGLAYAQDSAVFDTQQNAWKLYYQNPETGQWTNAMYVARTAILPSIKASVSNTGSQFSYHYTVRNQRASQQNISVIRIWGIPSIYSVPNLPPVTANIKTDNDNWTKQNWAQLQFKRKFEKSVIKAPSGWSAGLRVDEDAGQTSFVWTPGLKDSDSNGVEPGRAQSGFIVLRPELPGVARTYLQGRIAEP